MFDAQNGQRARRRNFWKLGRGMVINARSFEIGRGRQCTFSITLGPGDGLRHGGDLAIQGRICPALVWQDPSRSAQGAPN